MTYEDAVKIPEARRTSAQQRIVAEWEWEQAQQAAQQSEQAVVQTIVKSVPNQDFLEFHESYERYLAAIAHLAGAAGPYDPRVAQRDDHILYVQFRAMPAKDRDYLTHVTDVYFQNHPDLSWSV
jgi:hypothetical protein